MRSRDSVLRVGALVWLLNAIETVKHGNENAENVRIRGVDPVTMFDIDGVSIDAGRIWTEGEGASGARICVIGSDMLTNLFPNARGSGVGQEIRVGGLVT